MSAYGYVWMSPQEDSEIEQTTAILESGVAGEMIVVERQSGKEGNRQLYTELIGRLNPGDLLVVANLDKLGRNSVEMIEQWRMVTQIRQAHLVALDIPLINTQAKASLVTNTAVADVVLQAMYHAAHIEREKVKKRQSDGISAARVQGVKFGRPNAAIPPEYESVKERYMRKELSSRVAAAKLGVSQNTFLQWISSGKGKQSAF